MNKEISDTLPWHELLETALGILRISPEHFWAMTPVEFLTMIKGWKKIHGIDSFAAIKRSELNTLMLQFPDI